MRRHILPVIGRKRLKKLSPTDVRGLVQVLIDSGLGVRMVQFVHAVLRNALERLTGMRRSRATSRGSSK